MRKAALRDRLAQERHEVEVGGERLEEARFRAGSHMQGRSSGREHCEPAADPAPLLVQCTGCRSAPQGQGHGLTARGAG